MLIAVYLDGDFQRREVEIEIQRGVSLWIDKPLRSIPIDNRTTDISFMKDPSFRALRVRS